MTSKWKLFLLAILVTAVGLIISFISFGAGHGSGIPMLLFFPAASSFDTIREKFIPGFASHFYALIWVLAALQFPAYSLITGRGLTKQAMMNRRSVISGVDGLLVLLTLVIGG